MTSNRFLKKVSVMGAVFGVLACVTVNVNFPESTVQKATDDYVKDLYKAKKRGKLDTSSLFLISVAHAADVNVQFRVKTDKSLAIQKKMSGRISQIDKYKRQAVLGESIDGKLVLKKPDTLKPILRKKVERLVDAENEDRQELYEEIASVNRTKEKAIRKSFARSFRNVSPTGTWIEKAAGKWKKK